MGVDLILKHKDKSIACLGRAYHYEIDGEVVKDREKITVTIDQAIQDFKDEMLTYLGYSPENQNELLTMREDILESLDGLTDTLIDAGQKLCLADILEDGKITAEEG